MHHNVKSINKMCYRDKIFPKKHLSIAYIYKFNAKTMHVKSDILNSMAMILLKT
jgi:hypothetical protein